MEITIDYFLFVMIDFLYLVEIPILEIKIFVKVRYFNDFCLKFQVDFKISQMQGFFLLKLSNTSFLVTLIYVAM